MATLTTADIRAYVAHRLEDGAANATINRELRRSNGCSRWRSRREAAAAAAHSDAAEHNVRKGFFERAQFEAVAATGCRRVSGVVTLAYYTGWRIDSEILRCEWHQIDREGRRDPAGAGHHEEPRRADVQIRRARRK